jgi:hypothetical protein
VVRYFSLTHPHGEKDMAASNDRLKCIVGAEVETPADKYPGQNISGGGDTLSGSSSNAHCEIKTA